MIFKSCTIFRSYRTYWYEICWYLRVFNWCSCIKTKYKLALSIYFQIRDHIIRIVNLNIYKESFQFKTHAADIVREEREREEKRIQKKRGKKHERILSDWKWIAEQVFPKVLSMSKHLLIHMLKTGVQELVKAVTNHCSLHVFVVKDFVS